MDIPDDNECLRIALELIEEHGESASAFLQAKIDACWDAENLQGAAKLLLVRNTLEFLQNNGSRKH